MGNWPGMKNKDIRSSKRSDDERIVRLTLKSQWPKEECREFQMGGKTFK